MARSERTETTSVIAPVAVEIVDALGGSTELDAELRYDVDDPYAVQAVFSTPAGPVAWTFSRDLLDAGVFEPSGEGDVHVWPCLSSCGVAVTVIELSGEDQPDALVQLASADVLHFLGATRSVVAPGTESDHLDLDSLLEAILRADAPGGRATGVRDAG